jgi:hypothetical protein
MIDGRDSSSSHPICGILLDGSYPVLSLVCRAVPFNENALEYLWNVIIAVAS